jgi:hypothetical protein
MPIFTTNQNGAPIRIDYAADGAATITTLSGPVVNAGAPIVVTIGDLIFDALLDIGEVEEGATLTATQAKLSLRRLNRMLDSWNAERLCAPAIMRETFPLTTVAAYTIGRGADFDTTRPPRIEFAEFQDATGVKTPVTVRTVEEWEALTSVSPTQTGDRVTDIYYEATPGVGTINVYPTPTAGGSLVLGTWKQLTRFDSINDQVALPPGYEEAIVAHLTIRLAPSYGKSASAETVQIATLTKANLKRVNKTGIKMNSDDALLGRRYGYDIRTGDFRR